MKKLSFLLILGFTMSVISCSTVNPHSTSPHHTTLAKTSGSRKPIDPISVAIYSKDKKPDAPYQVVGLTKISKFNQGGNLRQEATLHDLMRQVASALGGNAVINVKDHKKSVTATVVATKRVIV